MDNSIPLVSYGYAQDPVAKLIVDNVMLRNLDYSVPIDQHVSSETMQTEIGGYYVWPGLPRAVMPQPCYWYLLKFTWPYPYSCEDLQGGIASWYIGVKADLGGLG